MYVLIKLQHIQAIQSTKQIHATGVKRGKSLQTSQDLFSFYSCSVEKAVIEFFPFLTSTKTKVVLKSFSIIWKPFFILIIRLAFCKIEKKPFQRQQIQMLSISKNMTEETSSHYRHL